MQVICHRVLILVLVEDSLRAPIWQLTVGQLIVLILVLVEDSLRASFSYLFGKEFVK